ncbi:MAG: hypothetical protein WAU24_06820 [Chitinophagaceae bacterium]
MFISYNKNQFYRKFLALTLIALAAAMFIFFHPPFPKSIDWQSIYLFVIYLLLALALLLIVMQLLFFPNGVQIDNVTQSLTIHYFLKRAVTINVSDIKYFTTTKIITRSSRYEGILVHTIYNRQYLFTDFNLTDHTPVRAFLENKKITFAGHEKFKNISYFITFFKHR